MIAYPQIDPVVFALGPIKVHWYGVMYLLAFASAWWLGRHRTQAKASVVKPQQIDDLIFYAAIGVIIGGRVGSVLFYNLSSFVDNPLYLFKIWQGGMSFHGGFLGVLVAMAFYCRKIGCRFFELTDFIAPLVPLGLAFGRLGNFINAELWGAPGQVAWAMKLSCEQFPADRYVDFAGPICLSPRHPSQLYEMLLEGVLLFIVLWFISAKPRPVMMVSGYFLLLYGLARSSVELIRLPDAHIGYLFHTEWITRGFVLSLPMIIIGIAFIIYARRAENYAAVS